ncbi:tetratricopeptide repeat protein [Natronospira bacteriovora]|uniref:Uncharacterized protein n=1 Tax=Natronospira bacteriovora TaxID=3069753 RepID=A0ABU0W9M4_9GAMM|nr:hypothetical protein [Natronospira sp. AB-CW4]MDQ2070135.1 hypothetical protein [Natronospira sp. AB-CW4]
MQSLLTKLFPSNGKKVPAPMNTEFWRARSTLGRKEIKALNELNNSFTGVTDEAEAFTRNRAAIEAIEFLTSVVSHTSNTKELKQAIDWKMKLLYRSRRWKEITDELDLTYKHHPHLLDSNSVFYIARAFWELGQFRKAERFFQRAEIPSDGHKQRIYERFRHAWWVSKSGVDSAELRDPERIEWHTLKKTALEWYERHDLVLDESEVEQLLKHSVKTIEAAYRFHKTRLRSHDFPTTDHVDASRLIFVSGFGWSGSGAVTAFLEDHDEVARVSDKELVWTQGRTKIPMTSLAQIWPDGIFSAPRFADFIQTGLLGLLDSNNTKGKSERVYPVSLLGECSARGIESAALVEMISSSLNTMSQQNHLGGILTCLSRLVTDLLTWHLHGRELGLLDNAIMTPKIHVLNLFPGAKSIVVKRNLPDQYAARRLESRRRETPKVFEKQIWNTVKRFNDRGRQIADRSRILPISFEHFLEDEKLRRYILEWIDTKDTSPPRPKRFNPSVSIKNVGIAREFSGKEWYKRFSAMDEELPYNEVFRFDSSITRS